MIRVGFILFALLIAVVLFVAERPAAADKDAEVAAKPKTADGKKKIKRSDKEWREVLTREQYKVTRQKGTERPFTGKFNDFKGEGVYVCVGCQNELFSSDTKFKSGTGWPSFWQPIDKEHVEEIRDTSHGMTRVEITCSRCDAHLGHVFRDGPKPTGLRYCINSVALDFVENNDDNTTAKKEKAKE